MKKLDRKIAYPVLSASLSIRENLWLKKKSCKIFHPLIFKNHDRIIIFPSPVTTVSPF